MSELEKELADEHAMLFALQRQWRRDLIDRIQTDEDELTRSAKMKVHAGNLAGIILRYISLHPVTVNHERGFASTELGDVAMGDVYNHVSKYFHSNLFKVERQRKRVIVRIDPGCIHSGGWCDEQCEWSKMKNEDYIEQNFEHIEGLRKRGLVSQDEFDKKEKELISHSHGHLAVPIERVMEIAQSVKDRFSRHGE